jgi:hypothetical protein
MLTAMHYWQGEERDTSDEEWEAAYAALDPIAQIGWVNRLAEANAVGADLVRDVFVAADEMHDHAMSEMDGNTQSEEINWAGDVAGGEATTSSRTDGSNHPSDSEEVDMEGEMHNVSGVFMLSPYTLKQFTLHPALL